MDKQPRDMAHRVVPAPPTRITVSGGPKAEPHLTQADSTDHRHTLAEVALLLMVALVLALLVVAVLLQQP